MVFVFSISVMFNLWKGKPEKNRNLHKTQTESKHLMLHHTWKYLALYGETSHLKLSDVHTHTHTKNHNFSSHYSGT